MNNKAIANTVAAFSAITFPIFAGTIDGAADIDVPASRSTPSLRCSALSGDIGISVLSQYIARGLVLENRGVVMQPYGNIYALLYEGGGFVERLSLSAGIWNDVNPSGPIAAPHATNKEWTEFLWQAGFEVRFAKRFSLGSAYRHFTSPSDAYHSGRAIESVLSFDDADLLAKHFSLQPKLTVLYELPAPGQNGLRGHSWYFAPSITPNYTFLAATSTPVTVGWPITLGLGSGFYAGKTFGYIAFGPQITLPLSFVPREYGTWIFSAGYSYYRLGSSTTAFARGHNANQHLFSASMELKF